MSLFFALIILLMVWFFIISPFLRLLRVSRQWQNAFKQTDERRRQQRQQQQQRQRGGYPQSKKKIDPTVGEYVEFTETVETTSATDSEDRTERTVHTTVESQITDVTWEEIPDQK